MIAEQNGFGDVITYIQGKACYFATSSWTCFFLGGGFKHVLFSSLPGEMIQFDEHIFQMGWFNHQPVFVDVNLFNKFKFQSDLKHLKF